LIEIIYRLYDLTDEEITIVEVNGFIKVGEIKKTSGKKRAYRIKLEIDIAVMADEENIKLERGLQVSLKDSEIYIENFNNPFLKKLFSNEFDFFAKSGLSAIREMILTLHSEVIFNVKGKKAEREQFITDALAQIEKGIRQRLKSVRGRPKTSYTLFELLNSIEVDLFLVDVLKAIHGIESDKITKTSVADKLFPYNSNSLQAFNRKLKQFQFTFEEILENKPLYAKRLEDWISAEKNNNKSGEV
jgi:hypothetical protein